MANVTIAGATYSDVPAIQVPSGSGTGLFYETKDVTYNLTGGATASVTPSEVVAGQGFSLKLKAPAGYNLNGVTVMMGGVDITSQVFKGDAGGGSEPELDTKTITVNGTYTASDDDLDGYSEVTVNVPTPVKTATGTFTGNGTRQMTIPCDFEPDLIYWTSDPGTTASSGTVAGIIAREMMSANRYRNNSTTNSHYAAIDITAMNTGGSSYSFRATYANSTVTLYCFSNNARSLFTNGRTYTYKFVKWTT